MIEGRSKCESALNLGVIIYIGNPPPILSDYVDVMIYGC